MYTNTIEKFGWILVHSLTLRPVRIGESIQSHTGEKYTAMGGTPPLHLGTDGRVSTNGFREFSPKVFGLSWQMLRFSKGK